MLSESLKRGKGADEGEDRLFLLGYKGNLYEVRIFYALSVVSALSVLKIRRIDDRPRCNR